MKFLAPALLLFRCQLRVPHSTHCQHLTALKPRRPLGASSQSIFTIKNKNF